MHVSVSVRIDLEKDPGASMGLVTEIFVPLQDPRDLEQNLPALLEQWYRYIWGSFLLTHD
eukprot:SAG11_NODE_1163_length_5624_cov_7.819186_2_plen_60_part_00